MNILFVAHQYLPEHVGGVELYTEGLRRALNQRGHNVPLLHRRSAPGQGLESGRDRAGKVYAAWRGEFTPAGRLFSTFREQTLLSALRDVLDEEAPELVHVQHLMGLPAALATELEQRALPYVITLWDFWWVCANAQLLTNDTQAVCDGPEAFLNCARCALARAGLPVWRAALPFVAAPLAWRNRALRQVLSGAARLIAPATFVGQWYAAHGVPREQMVVKPPGLQTAGARPHERTREDGRLRVGYLGGLSWQKGVHVLVEAVAPLESCELWIGGDPTVDPDYVAHLQQLAGPETRFLGRLTRPEVWQMLAEIDILAMPSLWYETFGFVISEAFAAGTPVVVSDIGVLAERVRHGEDGLVVAVGNVASWRRVLRNVRDEPAFLARLREGIRPVPTMVEHAAEIEQIYKDVVAA